MSKVTSIRLEDNLVSQLDELAADMNRPRNWVIEQAIRRYIEENGAQVRAIREALDGYRSGKAVLVPHEEVMRRSMEQLEADVEAEIKLRELSGGNGHERTAADYEAFLSSFGSWSDVDIDAFIDNIYESRSVSTRPQIEF